MARTREPGRWDDLLKFVIAIATAGALFYGFAAFFFITTEAHGQGDAVVQVQAHPFLAPIEHGHVQLAVAASEATSGVKRLEGRIETIERTQSTTDAEVARYLQGMTCVLVDYGSIRPDGSCSKKSSMAPIRLSTHRAVTQ